MSYETRLRAKYKAEVIPSLLKEFGYKSSMQVPRLEKICINQGLGDAVGDKKIVENAIAEMTVIAGQKAVATISRKDINFTFGVTEQIIFPEIDIDKVTKIQGMDITLVTTAKTDAEAKALLVAFGLPFSDKKLS